MDNNKEVEYSLRHKEFEHWYNENLDLVESLQTWLFYSYAIAEGLSGNVEASVEVADMTVYLLLFYLSSLQGNQYNFKTTLDEMRETLETDDQVILNALESLEAHSVLEYMPEFDGISIKIKPISLAHEHDHDHDHSTHGHK